METNNISDRFLDDQIKAVEDDLLLLYQDSGEDQSLQLTGAEVMAFVGAQVVIPILVGFIDKALFEKYGRIRTRKLAQEAREELLKTYQLGGDPVDQTQIENEVIESLVEEGIPLEHAKLIVSNAIGRISNAMGRVKGRLV
jgi:hypothetical protein